MGWGNFGEVGGLTRILGFGVRAGWIKAVALRAITHPFDKAERMGHPADYIPLIAAR